MDGQNYGREVAFSQPVINIGSDSGNDIILRGENIAEFHAMMHFDSGRWYLFPLDKQYKTTVNGRIITETGTALQNSSVVGIGDYRLTLMLNGVNTDIFIQSQNAVNNTLPDMDQAASQGSILLEMVGTAPTEIDAGGSVEYELVVTNAGPLVANMQLQLQGIPSAWVQILPPVVNLNEGRKGQFTVRISPPRAPESEAGVYNIRFIASSPNYPLETGVVNTNLAILPYSEFLVSGPMPRSVLLNRKKPTDTADVVIINNSNAASTYFLHTFDDRNSLYFAYERNGSNLEGQETVNIRPGDNARIPVRVGARKLPLFGFSSQSYHYNTSVTPSDRPGEGQTVIGEAVVRPQINTLWLILFILLLLILLVIFFQPYIHRFSTADEKRMQVIVYGNSIQLHWDVSRFASNITLSDGTTEESLPRTGGKYVSPATSTTYTLKADNFISNLLHITYEKTVQVMILPRSPSIDNFYLDHKSILYDQSATLNWSVEKNASSATVRINRQTTDLTAENYTGTQTQKYQRDTLFSLKAQNNSGYQIKSAFLNVAPDRIDLDRFIVWVRPNGIAVPSDNDSRRTTRWSALQQIYGLTSPTTVVTAAPRSASANLQPNAQSNTLNIPDDYISANMGVQSMNPEEIALSGGTAMVNTYVYQTPTPGAPVELLVRPGLAPTGTPTPYPDAEVIHRSDGAQSLGPVVTETAAPILSPEGVPFNREFSIKLMEIVEDPLDESGYRVIDYFPDYQLQPGEQIVLEWKVDGVSTVKIENLSTDDLNNSGGSYAAPEKNTTYTLSATTGDLTKKYALPVRVAGAADDGEGSGLKCELKVNATTLTEPGSVMVTWSGGGTNRVQLISSAKAESEEADKEKKDEAEAKEKGEKYTKPTNAPLSGGIIGDYLQPSGFMRVNVDKQTTFMLNAYDGGGNVICTKSAEVKFQGGNDKDDIDGDGSGKSGKTFRIVRIADTDNVSRDYYAVGMTIQYTIQFSGFEKGKEPTGSVMISDGTSSCSVTLPADTCSFQAKKAGDPQKDYELTVTAVYSGDNNYKKATTTAKEKVIPKMDTTTSILAAFKPEAGKGDVIVELGYPQDNKFGLAPNGKMTLTTGTATCELDVIADKLSCEGKVQSKKDKPYHFTITNMLLPDPNADRITAAYKGDDYFNASTSTIVLFRKVPTTTVIYDAYKTDEKYADFVTSLSWTLPWTSKDEVYPLVKGKKPTGTITFTPMSSESSGGSSGSTGNCIYDIAADTMSCEGNIKNEDYIFTITDMLVTEGADRIKAEYSGDSLFNASNYTLQFTMIPTKTTLSGARMSTTGSISLVAIIVPDYLSPDGKDLTGKLTFKSGSATCVLNIVDSHSYQFSECSGNAKYEDGKIVITNMKMNGTPGDTISAEYSGDYLYRPSTSASVPVTIVNKTDTKTTIEGASKENGKVTVTTKLVAVKEEGKELPDQKPTGKIVYTSGSATCTLIISSPGRNLSFDGCAAEKAEFLDDETIIIRGMLMSGTPGENIYAEYEGDDNYNSSVSAPVTFSKKETKTTIETGAMKDEENKINLTAVLEPDGTPAPTGTLTFNSGSATCVLDISNRDNLQFKDCTGAAVYKGGKFVITDMVMKGTPGEKIRAVYSGDDVYQKSSSAEVPFSSPDRVNTKLTLADAVLTGFKTVDFKVTLSWNKAEAAEKLPPGTEPTETITFTIGKDTCKLDVETNNFDCMGGSTTITGPEKDSTGTDVKYTWKFEEVQLKNASPDVIDAKYSGDEDFNPSSSNELEFVKVETDLSIPNAQKSPKGNIIMNVELSWIADPPSGKTPEGTITLTSGSKTCTLDITADPLKFKDCTADTISVTKAEKKWTFSITKLEMGTKAGDSITAAYSGDWIFLESSADKKFEKLKTKLTIEPDPYKPTVITSTFDSLFNWVIGKDEDGNDKYGTDKIDGIYVPTGKITFIASDKKSTDISKCVYDLVEQTLDCKGKDGEINVSDYEKDGIDYVKYAVSKVLLGDSTTDRVRAEYSGDSIFEASKSTMMPFLTIPTELDLTATKDTKNAISLTLKIIPDTAGPDEKKPTGKIVFQAGAGSSSSSHGSTGSTVSYSAEACEFEFDYDKGTTIFSYCSGEASIAPDGKNLIIRIDNLLVNGDPRDNITAEYSGDSIFIGSVSATVKFNDDEKIYTTLNLEDAKKSGTGYVDLKALLSWDKDEADGKLPTGTITFTIGSDSCKLTFDDTSAGNVKDFTCSEKGKTIITPSSSEVLPDEIITWTIEKLLLSAGSTADRVKAEYSGDANFNASSTEYILFSTKIPTTIAITEAKKTTITDWFANVIANLSWDTSEAKEATPTGTITFTAIKPYNYITTGKTESKCIYNIEADTWDCKGDLSVEPDPIPDPDPGYRDYKLLTWLLEDQYADRVQVEYSGDAIFEKSTSMVEIFRETNPKIDTDIIIETASKKGDTVSLTAKLTPAGDETGTIVFTSGSGTCTLKIDDHANPTFERCSADSVTYNADGTIEIVGMHLSAAPGDSIYAEYSGDVKYNKSTSPAYYFTKIDTTLDLTDPVLANPTHLNLNTLLFWDKDEADGRLPTGSITFTIGSVTCKLTFDDDPAGNVKDFTCSEKDKTVITPSLSEIAPDQIITWAMENILLSGGSTPDRVSAAYSGDENFNASNSEITLIQPVPTELEITGMDGRYSTAGAFDVNIDLRWTEEPVISGKVPEGTISVTIGKNTCTLDLSSLSFTDCTAGSVTSSQIGRKQTFTITKLEIGEAAENIVHAEYSGDSVFKPSKYDMKVDTTLYIYDQHLESNGTVEVCVMVMWDRSLTGYRRSSTPRYDLMPSGTIKLTAGSSSCTLQMQGRNHPIITDCDVRQASLVHSAGPDGVMYPGFQLFGLNMGTVTSQSITLEYSGDDLFNKSSEQAVLARKVDTELTIDEAYKTSEKRVNLEATLTWCIEGCGESDYVREEPVGPVTFALGSDSCKLSLADASFSCADAATFVDIFDQYGRPNVTYRQVGSKEYKDWKLTLTDVLLSEGNNPDRVKADFAGDAFFNASTSLYVLLDRIETETRLNNQVKMPDGTISFDLFLSWMETPPDASTKPTGTIKLTSGTDSCTLDISTKKLTGCSGVLSGPTEDDMTWTYSLTGLKIGSGTGESIKAEYSGDAVFQGSSSNELYFTKVDTELEITSAFKPNDPGLANTVTILSWDAEKAANRKPTGTVKYTVGSGSCTLDLSTEKLDCESLTPIDISNYSSAGRLGYVITIEEMELSDTNADSIKAQYSGDPVFNESSSQKVPFKTVDTEIIIRSSYKPDEKHITATAELDWDESEADGRIPSGSVKFMIGSGSCTLELETEKLSCDPGTGTVNSDRKIFKVKDMLIDDSSADRISAEYSGDGFFNPSKSVKVLIGRLDTEITISEAYKTGDAHVSLKALLSWDETLDVTDEEPLPTGTLKITVGEKTFTYDLETKQLTPESGSAERDNARQNYTFISLPFDDTDAQMVKVEYSGDRYYGPSSTVYPFDKIKTETVVLDYAQSTTPAIKDSLIVRVIPEKMPFEGSEPQDPFDVTITSGIAETQYTITCNDLKLNQQVTCDLSYYYPSFLPSTVNMTVNKDTDGRYNFNFTSGEVGDFLKATVRYKGDTIFEASENTYNDANYGYHDTSIQIDNAVQMSNGDKFLNFNVRVRNTSSLNSPVGKYVLTASNGQSCSFVYNYGIVEDTNTCGKFAEMRNPTSQFVGDDTIIHYYLRYVSGLGEEDVSSITIAYEGNADLKYHASEKTVSLFSNADTGPMSIGTVTENDSAEVTATVYMPYRSIDLLDHNYPAGPLVITKGDYTCTIPLVYRTKNRYTLDLSDPSVSADCGGGTVDVWSQAISSGSNEKQMVFELKNIPVSDHVAAKIKAAYTGDGYYQPSYAETNFHNRVNSKVSLSVSQGDAYGYRYLLLTVSSADASQTVTPSGGTMDILFKDQNGNTANHCVWDVSGTGHYFTCDQSFTGISYSAASYDPGSKTLVYTFDASRPFPTAYASAELSFEGNEDYYPSSGSFSLPPYEVVITALTDDIYDDGGRLYFNVNANSKMFPKFPEIFSMKDCGDFPGECREILHEIPLKASIRIKSSNITDNTGHESTAWPFSEDIHFTAGSDFDVSCTPTFDRYDGGDRLYTCEKTASFSTTGIKQVQAVLSATWMNTEATAEFPDMVAVKIPDSPLFGTTVILRPEASEIAVGSIVEAEADTTYNGSSIHPPSGSADKRYIYYTWTGIDAGNTRIAVCPDTGSAASCMLDITGDTKWIVAEFLGNDTYAPSTGLKSINGSSVTLGFGGLQPGSGG